MRTVSENNSPSKLTKSRRIAPVRKLPMDLAAFFGEFPANPKLSGLILRAVTHLKENPEKMATENEAFALGILAYIYFFPVVELCRILYSLASPNAIEARDPSDGWNRLQLISEISDPSRTIVRTNDLAYCVAPLDLCGEPVLFYTSDPGDRYCSYQFIDAHGSTFAHFGTREKDLQQRSYAIVGPGWRGKLSPELTSIQSLTQQNLLVGRIGVADNIAPAETIFSQSTLAPLSCYRKENGNDIREMIWRLDGHETDLCDMKWFEFASDVLSANPPPECKNEITALFARVGFEPGFEFRSASISPKIRSGLKRAIPVARNEIVSRAKTMGETNNGWCTLSLDRHIRETNYIDRAARAINSLTELPSEEIFSAECRSDESGRPLTGLHGYVLRFEKGKLPPTDSFWSVSVYERATHCFVDKVLEVQHGCGSLPLQHGEDGSLEICIQNTEPEPATCNWLRSPRSRFSIQFRAYAPRDAIVSGAYRLPVVRSLTN